MIVRRMMTVVTACGIVACSSTERSTRDAGSDQPRTIGHIERLSPALDALVPSDAAFEILAEGHEWTEGPVWVPWLKILLYSDVPRNAIYRWEEGTTASVWLEPSGYTGEAERGGEMGSNGLALEGHALVLAQHGDRRIARLETRLTAPAPVFATITDRYEGKRYNSPNDLVVHSSGAIYFTDPPYGLEEGMDDPTKELPIQGVYRVEDDGTVALLIDDLSRPNGIAFSPDEQTLYVANSDPNQQVIMAYDVAADGSIANGRVFFDSWGDGMAVDQSGNLFVTSGEAGVLVLSPDGTHLGSLVTGERTSNCTFGDDGSTLYVTSDMYLVRIRLSTKGVAF